MPDSKKPPKLDPNLAETQAVTVKTDTFPVDELVAEWETDDGETSIHEDAGVDSVSPEQGIVGASLTVLTGSGSGRFLFVGPEGATFGRSPDMDHVFSDTSMSRRHARLTIEADSFVLYDLGSSNGSYVDGLQVDGSMMLPPLCRLRLGVRTLLQFHALDELSAGAVRKVSRALFLDPLTGTGNRYQLERRLRQEISFARRHLQPLGVMLLDIDRFKLVNDHHGHQVGDHVLANVGELLLGCVRAEDAVFRYGGEEFCILVRAVDQAGLVKMAERVRSSVDTARFPAGGGEVGVTVSVGVATIVHTEEETNQSVIFRADRALYQAKQAGRNCVRVFTR